MVSAHTLNDLSFCMSAVRKESAEAYIRHMDLEGFLGNGLQLLLGEVSGMYSMLVDFVVNRTNQKLHKP